MDRYQKVKGGCTSEGFSLKLFEPQTRSWPRKVLHVVKKRTRTWELNTWDNFANIISLWDDVIVTYIKCESTIKNKYKSDACSQLCRLLMLSSSAVVLGNMDRKVNEDTCV